MSKSHRKLNPPEQLDPRQLCVATPLTMLVHADAQSNTVATYAPDGRVVRLTNLGVPFDSEDSLLLIERNGAPRLIHFDYSRQRATINNPITGKQEASASMPIRFSDFTEFTAVDINGDGTSEIIASRGLKDPTAWWDYIQNGIVVLKLTRNGQFTVDRVVNRFDAEYSNAPLYERQRAAKLAKVESGDSVTAEVLNGWSFLAHAKASTGEILVYRGDWYSFELITVVNSRQLLGRLAPGPADGYHAGDSVQMVNAGPQDFRFVEIVIADHNQSAVGSLVVDTWSRYGTHRVGFDAAVYDSRYRTLGQQTLLADFDNDGDWELAVVRGKELTVYEGVWSNSPSFWVGHRSALRLTVDKNDNLLAGHLPGRAGDENGDGFTDRDEYKRAVDLIAAQIGSRNPNPQSDITLDGKVTVDDSIFLSLEFLMGLMWDTVTGHDNTAIKRRA